MKPKLLIVTGNNMKFKEESARFSEFFDCVQERWDEPEIQGTPEEIITHKLHNAYNKFKQPVLVEDTSVALSELNGFPGPYIKDFFKSFPPYEMGMKFAGTRMKASAWFGFYDGKGEPVIVESSVEGNIVKPKTQDHQNRWFDLCFQVDGTDKPMIEFSHEEKNKFSHRGKAMDKLIEILGKKH
jgi:inosine triphosphate pyrophosphatase